MFDPFRRIARVAAVAAASAAIALTGPSGAVPAAAASEPAKAPSLWFDATQLPSFTGVVDRFLANPDGQVDRLLFKEGPQIVFPPDAFEAIRAASPPGRPLVVWGIRARSAAVITMLAFGPPDGQASVLDRFYWRPEQRRSDNKREMLLIGTVWQPYLSPQGQVGGAILQNGDVIRVDPKAAAAFKNLFAPDTKIVAAGTGAETPQGKAIDADRVGESVETLERLPQFSPSDAGPGQTR